MFLHIEKDDVRVVATTSEQHGRKHIDINSVPTNLFCSRSIHLIWCLKNGTGMLYNTCVFLGLLAHGFCVRWIVSRASAGRWMWSAVFASDLWTWMSALVLIFWESRPSQRRPSSISILFWLLPGDSRRHAALLGRPTGDF